jgi:hypothetical protein
MLGRLKEKARSGTGSYARRNYVSYTWLSTGDAAGRCDDPMIGRLIGREVRSSFEERDEGIGGTTRTIFPGVVTGWSPDTQEYTVEYADPTPRDAGPWYLSERNLQFHLVMDVERFNEFLRTATTELLDAMVDNLDDRCARLLKATSSRLAEGKREPFCHAFQVREDLKECFSRHSDSERDCLADLVVRAIGSKLLFCDGQRFAIGLEHAAYDWVRCETETCRKWRLLHKNTFEYLRDYVCAPRTLSEPHEDVAITCEKLGNVCFNIPGFLFSEATPDQDKRRIVLLKTSVSSCQHPAFMDKSYEYFSEQMLRQIPTGTEANARALWKLRQWNELYTKFGLLFLKPARSGWLLGINLWDIFVERWICSETRSNLLSSKLSREEISQRTFWDAYSAFAREQLAARILKDDEVQLRLKELKVMVGSPVPTARRAAAPGRIDFHNAPSRYEIANRVEHVYRLVQHVCYMLPELECFQPLRDSLSKAVNAPDHMLRVAVVGDMAAGKSYFLNVLFQMFAPAPLDYKEAFAAERHVVGLIPDGTLDVNWIPLHTVAGLCEADDLDKEKDKYQFLCPEGMHKRGISRSSAFTPNVCEQVILRAAQLLARFALFTAEDTCLRGDMNGQTMSLAVGKLPERSI